jgi:hypothetical protein
MTNDDFHSSYQSLQNELYSAIREAQTGYWNALLTVNGIFIGVFSAIAIFAQSDRVIISVLIAFSMASSGLVIQNFLARLDLLSKIGALSTMPDQSSFLQAANNIYQLNADAFNRNRRRESVVSTFLLCEGVIILWLVLPSFR